MHTIKSFEHILYEANEDNFEDIALQLFRFQAANNLVYRTYLSHLGVHPSAVTSLDGVPFLPVSFFKTHQVITGQWEPEVIFSSSGTTGSVTSRHAVRSLSFYQEHSQRLFESFYCPLTNYHILALLPSYLERDGSSLIYMVDHFIRRSNSPHSGFYLNEWEALLGKIEELRNDSRKILLLGVSFALLDLAERFNVDLSHCTVMETGGMKGRRKELIREELHGILTQHLHTGSIHSEYGMTELLSQGYSKGNGVFALPDCMKIIIKDINDPFGSVSPGKTGIINVVDLANFDTCAFIETQDLGRKIGGGVTFEVLGRMDNSDVRGCNLLVG